MYLGHVANKIPIFPTKSYKSLKPGSFFRCWQRCFLGIIPCFGLRACRGGRAASICIQQAWWCRVWRKRDLDINFCLAYCIEWYLENSIDFRRNPENCWEFMRFHIAPALGPMRFESKVHLATTSCGDLIATYGTPFYMKVDVEDIFTPFLNAVKAW